MCRGPIRSRALSLRKAQGLHCSSPSVAAAAATVIAAAAAARLAACASAASHRTSWARVTVGAAANRVTCASAARATASVAAWAEARTCLPLANGLLLQLLRLLLLRIVVWCVSLLLPATP